MNNTKIRLNEACFFLKKLEANYFKDPELVYYLDAFITSSRSVLWVMKKEYNKINGWKKWYDLKQFKKDEDDLTKKITELRNRSQKRAPIEPHFQVQMQIYNCPPEVEKNFKRFIGKEVIVKAQLMKLGEKRAECKFKKNSISCTGKMDSLQAIVPEFPEEDVLSVCKKYYKILELLVLECEKKFG